MAKQNYTIIDGQDAHQIAKKKARYGHRDWIVWIDRKGEKHTAPKNSETLKMALLSIGTQGKFSLYEASTGVGWRVNWRIGVIMFGNAKLGF